MSSLRIGLAVLGLLATRATCLAAPGRVIPDGGVPRAAVAPETEKLDVHLRRRIGAEPATVPAGTGLEPITGAWEQDGTLHVRVRVDPATDVGALTNQGFTAERRAGDLIEGWIPAANVAALGSVPGVRFVVPVRPGRARATADVASRANLARGTGVDGTGVVVGIISDGAGSLPASAVPAGCEHGTGAEGQAIADIVGALAPGARILFASGATSGLGFIGAVQCLQTAGATVMVDDLGYFDQPYFEDGPVAQAVRAAVQAGVSFHSAAGNEADSHYQATFRPTAGSSYHDFATAGAADDYDEITLGRSETLDCVLQWNDPFGAAADDYDLEFYDMSTTPPTLVLASTNRQTGTQDPIEEVAVQNRRQTVRVGVAVKRVSGAARVLGLFCFGGSPPQYVTPAGSIVGHSALPEVVTIGAVDVNAPGLATVESFSSQGPVDIYFPARETRAKPDMVAFDGVTTATPGFSPFFGTSAAAPDTAAVAALMRQKNGCRTPAQIRDALTSTAVDIEASGFDAVAGFGRLDALGAGQAVPPPNCQTDAQCDDGNPCTADTCAGCACEHTSACDDGDPCSIDTCDPTTGCASTPIEGYEGVACVCRRDLTAACGATLPHAVQHRFARACRLVARAADASAPGRQRALVRHASAILARAESRTTRVARRGTIQPACSDLARSTLDAARARTAQLLSTL